MYAAGQREAEMADRKPFDDSRRAKMEFRDDPIVVLALGANLFDAADYSPVTLMDLPAQQQLDPAFIFFRHDGLRGFWR